MKKTENLWKIREIIAITAETFNSLPGQMKESGIGLNELTSERGKHELTRTIREIGGIAHEKITELLFIFAMANLESGLNNDLLIERFKKYAYEAFKHPENETFYSKENFERQFNDLLSASHPVQVVS